MNSITKAALSHIVVLLVFILVALAYFSPVLQGKTIFQSDIVQYTGMAKEQNDFRDEFDAEPYWTNSAFGGMPTYQLGANYPHNYIKKLDRALRFLPRPADYLFLYFIGFYVLLCCLKVDFRLAALGALAFGFSTYLIIILGVGHNAKAHAIAYMPLLLAGIVLVFRKYYIPGFLLTALAMALEVGANHFQMTYYFMLLVLVLGAVQLYAAIREKELRHFGLSVCLLSVAVVLGIATNATNLMATKEYADWSTRGKSELTINPDGSPKESTGGLDYDYITEYSYGLSESLNLFVPRLFGGSNGENLGESSKAYSYLISQGLPRSRAMEFAESLPLYWGDQPIVAGPAYVGATVLFLFILALFLLRGPTKWWLLGGALMSLMLSWGKNFSVLTDFMIQYFPFYNKFRAVSSIQVILELCIPILAILGLVALLDAKREQSQKVKAITWSAAIGGGLALFLLAIKGLFHFEGVNDGTYTQYFGNEVMAMIVGDRKAVYTADTLRSLVLVVLTAGLLWLFVKEKIKFNLALMALAGLILYDLVGVDRRYVNKDDFVSKRQMEQPFQASVADQEIQKDQSVFRVYNLNEGLSGGRTSYFHKSLGGYHAAKPRPLQELFDYQVYQGNGEILNMFNVKYLIQQDENGQAAASINPEANGNAWFVNTIQTVADRTAEMTAMEGLDTKITAVVNAQKFPGIQARDFVKDSTASIQLETYAPNAITYSSQNPNDGLAVFSEMYYPHGWVATVDGNPIEIIQVDYALRALEIPAGQHTITFEFKPKVVENGSRIALGSTLVLVLLLIGGIVYQTKQSNGKRQQPNA